jgi:DNA repair exonuclease SbcCD ATPase subunit
VLLQIDAIKAASLERQAQLDRETAELKQQQDDLTAKLKDFQQRVGNCQCAERHAVHVQ